MRLVAISVFALYIFGQLIASNAIAEQLYKCTDANGRVAFQGKPCSSSQGKSESIVIKSTGNSNYTPQSYSSPPDKSNAEDYEKILIRAEKRSNKRHDKLMADYDKKVCDRYKGYLQDEVDEWKTVESNGYKQWQKEHYAARIKSAEREMEAQCQ